MRLQINFGFTADCSKIYCQFPILPPNPNSRVLTLHVYRGYSDRKFEKQWFNLSSYCWVISLTTKERPTEMICAWHYQVPLQSGVVLMTGRQWQLYLVSSQRAIWLLDPSICFANFSLPFLNVQSSFLVFIWGGISSSAHWSSVLPSAGNNSLFSSPLPHSVHES